MLSPLNGELHKKVGSYLKPARSLFRRTVKLLFWAMTVFRRGNLDSGSPKADITLWDMSKNSILKSKNESLIKGKTKQVDNTQPHRAEW